MTEDAPWLDDHQQRVWRLWLDVTNGLPALLNKQLARDTELSLQDFEVLVSLSEAPDQSMRVVAMADAMHWERSRLSHQLTRMEKRGLVRRESCCSDGRGQLVRLTGAGWDAVVAAAPGHADMVRRVVFGGLNMDHLDELEKILDHIRETMAEERRSLDA
ncbi:MarR family winged helix-turn-helix transcriptional regulator [Acidipropionibacterium virtanenii]|uniref:Transcriptional regulator SlyA n=1 Tax=Acidipropionibacterium virtanenii TaxID=2057246 RepID=A0A344UQA3_9ACTN|nr:MarR family transcriptional regulator [Acidipropionibacterium virtanenii]AXE37451.1 Transcriptional regulator SlyA [Acidipropionibacterium virtanenii]